MVTKDASIAKSKLDPVAPSAVADVVDTKILKVPFPTLLDNDLMTWLLLFQEAVLLNEVSGSLAVYYAKLHLRGGALHWAVRCKKANWDDFRLEIEALATVVSSLVCFNKQFRETDVAAADRFESLWMDLVNMTRRDSPYRKMHKTFLRNFANSLYKPENRDTVLKTIRKGSASDLKSIYDFII